MAIWSFPVDQIGPAVDGVIGEQLTRLAGLFATEEGNGTDEDEADQSTADDSETESEEITNDD